MNASQIKLQIQEMLHREITFQNVSGVEKGAKILGLKDFWDKVAVEFVKWVGDFVGAMDRVFNERNC